MNFGSSIPSYFSTHVQLKSNKTNHNNPRFPRITKTNNEVRAEKEKGSENDGMTTEKNSTI
jgi:hypothetical protein